MSIREPIHILGAGSVGMCWAALIRSALPSYPVTLLVRDDRAKNQHLEVSLKRLYSQTTIEELSLPVQSMSSSEGIIQNLVVTTKAYQATEAVEIVLPRLDKTSSNIIVLCNGALSVKDDLSKFGIPLVLATTTHGAYTENNKQQIVHAGVGKTFVENLPGLANLWNSVGLHCQSLSSTEMNHMLWKKLAANCAINPLTAIFQCTNGDLVLEPSFPQLLNEIIQEIVLVANSMDSNAPTSSSGNMVTQEELTSFVYQVIRDTQDNKSSMYQDIIWKKQKSEIDHLNGYIVKKGRQAGIDCSTNEDICLRIRELQHDQL
jgi:2-dehydropantoate 2-reductase